MPESNFMDISCEFIWLPSPSELEHLQTLKSKDELLSSNKVLELRRFLSRTLGNQVKLKDVTHKINISIMDYQNKPVITSKSKKNVAKPYVETLFIFSCNIILEKNFKICYQHIINLYCKEKNACFETLWQLNMSPVISEALRIRGRVLSLNGFYFGNFVGLNTFVQHFDSSSVLEEKYKITQVRGRFVHEYKRFELYFIVGNSTIRPNKRNCKTHRLFKLHVEYSSLRRIVICNDEKFSVYLHFSDYPLLYGVCQEQGRSDEDDKEYISFLTMTESTAWERAVNLFEDCPQSLKKEFSMNTVLKLERNPKEKVDLTEEYECYGNTDLDYTEFFRVAQFTKHIDLLFASVRTLNAACNMDIKGITSVHYNCFYALRCLLTRSNEMLDELEVHGELAGLNKFFIDALKDKNSDEILTNILYDIYHAMDNGYVYLYGAIIKSMYQSHMEALKNGSFTKLQSTKEVILMRRAYLTPTHIRFIPPQPALTNRMIEAGNLDYFLRVSIRDINLQQINFSLKGNVIHQKAFFKEYIIRQLLRGIKLGNRHYKYIGASSSQLRSHSLSFYAASPVENEPGRYITADDIRKAVGNLDDIQNVPKYMARMGMSFSQAMGRIRVPQHLTNIVEPDEDVLGDNKVYLSDSDEDDDGKGHRQKFLSGKIVTSKESESSELSSEDSEFGTEDEQNKSEENINDLIDAEPDPYNFSDGIGRMSQEVANMIHEELGYEEEKPSAVQIRYAGCKGMLVLDPTMEGAEVKFRKSMKKYESDHDSLEILKVSEPRNFYLNRQLITILEQMGIPKKVFIKLQKCMIQDLIKSMFYDENAVHVLNVHCDMRLNFIQLHDVGLTFTEDPFFRSLILAIFKDQIRLLRTKARIALPENEARNMFGVLDETQYMFSDSDEVETLKYGQVFVQYTKWNSNETVILEGTVLVTKNPCMHPGDVRKFTAVNLKQLHHIRDCIVFPACGPRPHPDEMAGSDLDGDEYSVIWLEDICFERENHPPMHFAVKKKNVIRDRPILATDELGHVQDFILNDVIGLIANAHLAQADFRTIFGKYCMKLAKKYAISLDFVKTGHTVKNWKRYSARRYPDFMQKHGERETYISVKALGHLYRSCKILEMGFEGTTDVIECTMDTDLVYDGWEKYESSAKQSYQRYSKEIATHLKAYGIDNEGELLSGKFSTTSKMYENQRGELGNLQEILKFEMDVLFSRLQKIFFKEFGGRPNDRTFSEDMLRKASAWYIVTYSKQENASKRYFGLPWAVADILAFIKAQRGCTFCPSQDIFMKKSSYVERAINKCVEKYTKVEDQADFKYAVLDVVHRVLSKWLQKGSDLHMVSIDNVKSTMEEVYESVTSKLLNCDDSYIELMLKTEKKITSPGYYVLESLMRMANMGISCDPNYFFNDDYQKLGMYAWTTLIKLACSCNPQYVGLTGTEDLNANIAFHVEQESKSDLCQVVLKDGLLETYIRDEQYIKDVLMEYSGVEEVDLIVKEKYRNYNQENDRRRKPQRDKNHENNYTLTMMCRGSRLANENMKEFVSGDKFYDYFIKKHEG